MTDRNIKFKIVTRIQLYGDDNIYTNTQYEYPLSGSTVNNACKMRFNLQLGDLILSKNSRMVVETCFIPSLTNMEGKYEVLRLISPSIENIMKKKGD